MKSNYLLKSVNAFINRFPQELEVGAETIGLEPEMLAVDVHGRAASYAKVKAVFDDFCRFRFKSQHTTMRHKSSYMLKLTKFIL